MSGPCSPVSLRARLQAAYLGWGYLLAAGLPLAQVLGRAVFTIVLVIYGLWSLIAFRLPPTLDRRLVLLFAALLAAYALGVPGSLDPLRGTREWLKFAAEGAVWLFAYGAVLRVPDGLERLVRALGLGTVTMLAVLYVKLSWQIQAPDFDPTRVLQEDGLAFLTPFALYALLGWSGRAGRVAAVLFLALAGYYVLLAQGRAALLGLGAGLFVFAWLVRGWRVHTALVMTVVLGTLAFASQGEVLWRGAGSPHTLSGVADRFTAGRTQIWRQALSSPPEHLMVGVGLGNLGGQERVLTIDRGPRKAPLVVKHLHNFVLDCWYETGLIGLVTLFLWLGVCVARGARHWRLAPPGVRAVAGTLLAGTFAILATGLFSFSYLSKPFTVYLPLFLGALCARGGDR
jgi:O-antigen ligase